MRIPLHGAHALAAKNVHAKHAAEFKPIKTSAVEEMFGSWQKAQDTHVSDGGS